MKEKGYEKDSGGNCGLNGWVQRGGQAKYSIVDGMIVGGQLNSGIQVRSESRPDYKEGRVHGYQVEIDPASKSYNKNPKNLLADGSETAGIQVKWRNIRIQVLD